jgi:hypothetical protein
MTAIRLCCFFLLTPLGFARADAVIHVAPAGNDANPGTIDQPVRTPAHARDLVRAAKGQGDGPITVRFAAGSYYLAEPLILGPEDSGTADRPITYAAAPGASVILSGGARLNLDWKSYKDGIMQAEVSTKLPFEIDQLFVDGRRMRMARYPNHDPKALPFNGTAADAIEPSRVKRWAHPAGAYVHALHKLHWGDFHYRVTGVDDQGRAKLEGGWQNNRRMGMHERHRFVENVFEELDAPGEWYFDAANRRLFFDPPQGVDLRKATVEAAGIRHLVEFRGTREKPIRFVTLHGLTFTHTSRTFMENREPLLRSDWTIYRGGAVLFEGCEDCGVTDCDFDQVGGNAVFVNKYNRRVEIRGCKIIEAGANGVCFVGDPAAVRSPLFEYGQTQPLEAIDLTPGPKTDDYPAHCHLRDCLIAGIGQVEKQSAGVEIAMSMAIDVVSCSIYDVPRAGINIGDGCWGGHLIEGCDVFDTVQETGDHGSFNSWGRDRYWLPNIAAVNERVKKNPDLPLLDCFRRIEIRHNRWRCDHGWDIDLDDGSSNYVIEDNLCLHGGIKLREGYHRWVSNNIIVGNSFHPHVWFDESRDLFLHNIVGSQYHPIGMPKVWGISVDYNLFPDEETLKSSKALGLDAHSRSGDPLFVDPAVGDYRVKEGSPARELRFRSFAMDQFGVTSPRLRAQARTPRLPAYSRPAVEQVLRGDPVHDWLGAKIRGLAGMGEMSAAGLADEFGVLLIEVPEGSAAARAGLRKGDVILRCEGKRVSVADDLLRVLGAVPGGKDAELGVWRDQHNARVRVPAASISR